MTTETIYAALLVLPLFALAAFAALSALAPRRCPATDVARAEAEWAAMVSQETAPLALAEIMRECAEIDPDAVTARWSEAMSSVATVDADAELAAVHAASLAALARSSARIDAAARRAQFVLVVGVALDHGAAYRDAA